MEENSSLEKELKRVFRYLPAYFKYINLKDKLYTKKLSALEEADGKLALIQSYNYPEGKYAFGKVNIDNEDNKYFYFDVPWKKGGIRRIRMRVNELEGILIESH